MGKSRKFCDVKWQLSAWSGRNSHRSVCRLPSRAKRRPSRSRKRRLEANLPELGYLAMRYVRSPLAFFADSIFSPPLLPRSETKPRTVWRCQPVVSMISVSVAPPARLIRSMTVDSLIRPPRFGVRPSFGLARFLRRFGLGALCGFASAFWLRGPTQGCSRGRCGIDCLRAHRVFSCRLLRS